MDIPTLAAARKYTDATFAGGGGAKGKDGFSPTVAVKESTDDSYVLTVTDKNGSYDTPNLKGKDGSGGDIQTMTASDIDALFD